MKKLLLLLALLPFTINASAALSVTIKASPGDTVCAGTYVTLSVINVTGFTPLSYGWFKNGVNLPGEDDSAYTLLAEPLSNFWCRITGIDSVTGTTVTVTSNTIILAIAPPVTPIITLTGSTGVLPGGTVTVNAAVTDAGPTYNVKWKKNGVLFATTTVPVVTCTIGTGTDTITATVISTSNGCHDTANSALLFVAPATDVRGITGGQAVVQVYPNPASSNVVVRSENNIDRVTISDFTGRVVAAVQSSQPERELGMDMALLPPGVYMVRVQCGEGMWVSKIIRE
jgi:hypothetical protein